MNRTEQRSTRGVTVQIQQLEGNMENKGGEIHLATP